jgi:hypothetical protein
MLMAVHGGFLTGDLQPLAAYLAADANYPIDDIIRAKLVEMIQAGKLTLKGDRGRGNVITKRRTQARDRGIGEFVWRKLRTASRGDLPNIIHDAAVEFGVEDEVARKAHQAFQRRIAPARGQKGVKERK